jgi:lipopolysaccharide transport system permease protein
MKGMRIAWGQHRRILHDLAVKQLKAKYAGSLLGFSWAILHPLLLSGAIAFVFDRVLAVGVAGSGIRVVAGFLPWAFMASSVQESVWSLPGQRALLRQFAMPRALLPLSTVYAQFLLFAAGLCAVLPAFLWRLPRVVVLLPFLVLLSAAFLSFTVGLTLLFSMLQVRIRDTAKAVEVGLSFWLWMTPVFYAGSMVPSGMRWITLINPAAPYIRSYQAVLCDGTLPSVPVMAAMLGWAALSLGAGWRYFSRHESELAKLT